MTKKERLELGELLRRKAHGGGLGEEEKDKARFLILKVKKETGSEICWHCKNKEVIKNTDLCPRCAMYIIDAEFF